jgi:transposase-like protein
LAASAESRLPVFLFISEIRKVICTTNDIESVNMRLRKVIKNPVHFRIDGAATTLIWLGLRAIGENFLGSTNHGWKER